MGGGGGDGGYGEQQAALERRKQTARNALNVAFGVAPTDGTGAARPAGGLWGKVIDSTIGDPAEYEPEAGEGNSQTAQAAKNKAAMDALYGKVRGDAFTAGARRLDEGRTTAGRDLKFELLSRGLNGGSVAVDQGSLLQRKYDEGRIDLGGKADGAVASLKAGDEGARLQLLQSIDNGMDQGSALSSAMAQMRNNADRASAEAIGTTIGDVFSNAGLLYDQERRARGERRANDWMSQYFPTGGGRGRSGGDGAFYSVTQGGR